MSTALVYALPLLALPLLIYIWHSGTTKADQMNGNLIEKAPDINSRASEGVARRGIEPLLPPWEVNVFFSFVEEDFNIS